MRKIMLNGQWELAEAGNDRLCEVQVPGSVLSGLYGAGKIEDPFYRTNEDVTRELFRKDYEFSRTFVAAEDILKEEKIILVCEGLDTLADIYMRNPFHVFTMDEYVSLIGKCLEHIPSNIVIHRLTGDGPKSLLIEPLWSGNKKLVLNTLNKYLSDMDIIQGSKVIN